MLPKRWWQPCRFRVAWLKLKSLPRLKQLRPLLPPPRLRLLPELPKQPVLHLPLRLPLRLLPKKPSKQSRVDRLAQNPSCRKHGGFFSATVYSVTMTA